MPLSLTSTNLLSSATISKFMFGTDDMSLGSFTSQEIFSVELAANCASQQIQKFCDFIFVSGSYTEVWDGAASDEIITKEIPINSITSIKFAPNMDFASASPLDSKLYCIGSNGLCINFKSELLTPRGRSMVQVVYSAGYTVIPYDLQMAALKQLQYLYKQIGKGDSMVGLKTIAKMNESQTKDDSISKSGLIAEVEGMCAPYRRFETSRSVMFTRVT